MRAISKRKKRFILRHYHELSHRQLAKSLKIGRSTVWRVFREWAGRPLYSLPDPKAPGRKPVLVSPEAAKKVLDCRDKYKANCNTLEMILRQREGLKISHNQVYKILKRLGRIHMQKKRKKRNAWVRFERKHSLSMWQADWKQLKNGRWLISFKDDASRMIVASREFDEATSAHSIEVLSEGIRTWGRPLSLLTGRDVQFYASGKKGRPAGKGRFQLFLEANGIKHILARVEHPQTCGKIERFFGEVERRLYTWHDFKTTGEVVNWYNNLLPNMSLDYENLETPVQAFRRKMHHKRKIINEVVEI